MLSQKLERFLRTSIRSVWEIELLLLLRKEPTRSWTTGELVRQLRASGLVVRDALIALQRIDLVGHDPEDRFIFRPATAELTEIADELAATYASTPASIMNVIWSTPVTNIQTFADAFRLRKENDDDS